MAPFFPFLLVAAPLKWSSPKKGSLFFSRVTEQLRNALPLHCCSLTKSWGERCEASWPSQRSSQPWAPSRGASDMVRDVHQKQTAHCFERNLSQIIKNKKRQLYNIIYIYMVQRCQPPPPPWSWIRQVPPPPCGCGPVVGLWWFRVGLELV